MPVYVPGEQNIIQKIFQDHFSDFEEQYDEHYAKQYGKFGSFDESQNHTVMSEMRERNESHCDNY